MNYIYSISIAIVTIIEYLARYVESYGYNIISLSDVDYIQRMMYMNFLGLAISIKNNKKHVLNSIILQSLTVNIIFWLIVLIFDRQSILYLWETTYKIGCLFFLNMDLFPNSFITTLMFLNVPTFIGSFSLTQLKYVNLNIYNLISQIYLQSSSLYPIRNYCFRVIIDIVLVFFLSIFIDQAIKERLERQFAKRFHIYIMIVSLLVCFGVQMFYINNLSTLVIITSLFMLSAFIGSLCLINICTEGILRIFQSFSNALDDNYFWLLFISPMIQVEIFINMLIYACFFVGIYFAIKNKNSQ